MNLSNALRTRRLFWVLLLGLLSCISAQVPQVSPKFPPPPLPQNPPHHSLPPHIKHIVDDLLRNNLLDAQLRNEEQPGFCALITQNFREIYHLEGGASNIEQRELISKRKLISKKTKFYIGSMTKPFTAGAILKLVQDGLLKPSDTIQNRLPYSFPPKRYKGKEVPIIISHLLAHTSGLVGRKDYNNNKRSDYVDGLINISKDTTNLPYREKVFNYFKDRELTSEPGTVFDYSNYGYLLLGFIIEHASRMSYAQYLKENIFDIAGMSNTKVADQQKTIDNKLAFGYIEDQSSFVNTDSSIDDAVEVAFSAGNIISTVEDLNKWYQALFSYKIIKEPYLDMAHKPHASINEKLKLSYGYGWIIDTSLGEDKKLIFHNGSIAGFSSHMLFQPSSKTLVVLLSNLNYLPVCIGLNGSVYRETMIDYLPPIMLFYATYRINLPVDITVLADSRCEIKRPELKTRVLRGIEILSLEDLINFDSNLGEFIPMNEILKKIQQ